jgi:hypothetical protein
MKPSPWLVLGLYPFAAGAMALNVWFLSLILGWSGWPIIAPETAAWAGIPLGLPPAWIYARHLTRLMSEVDGPAST